MIAIRSLLYLPASRPRMLAKLHRLAADVVMLDNMSVPAMRALCPRLKSAARGRTRPLEIEASGGVTLETVAEIATSGVDRISVGALTHSAPALDLALRLEEAS